MKTAHQTHLHSVLTALRLNVHPLGKPRRAVDETGRPVPFVTISRQAGSGGKALAAELARALNGPDRPDEVWSVWDHELVDKVSAEHNIPETYVQALEDQTHPWFGEFIQSLSSSARHEESAIYRRIAVAIRALANAGRAVIVGRGGAFLTAGIEGGVHVRLVAPLDYRVQCMAKRLQVSTDEAAARVREIDHSRDCFYSRHWPGKRVVPEAFTITLNTAQLSDQQMVACLLPLLVAREGGGKSVPSEVRAYETAQ